MEMERVIEFPHTHMDRRPRKRPRLGWYVTQLPPQAQVGMFFAQEVDKVTGFASSTARMDIGIITKSDYASSIMTKSSLVLKGELAQNGSPPWRDDDKDGHYMFELGDNLTSRCKSRLLSS